MDWKKISLLSGMAIVTWLLMIEWTQFDVSSEELGKVGGVKQAVNGEIPNIIDSEAQPDVLPAGDDLPALASKVVVSAPVENDAGNLVRVRTQVFDLLIDLYGGDIVSVKLLDHLNEMPADGGVPLQIFERSNERRYIASSGLIGVDGTDSKDFGRPLFNVRARDFVLGDQQALDVDLVVQQGLVEVVKRFSFTRDSYKIGVNYRIDNNSSNDWQASFFGQIKRDAVAHSHHA